jgi:hypothetical protein
MKRNRWMVLPALALAVVIHGGSANVARAQEIQDASTTVALESTSAALEPTSGDEIERWWGAAGAAMCGMEFRLVRVAPAIGMNPYVMAAGIGGCVLAIMDIATT